MKTTGRIFWNLSLILLLAFSSCTIQKRLYRPGFHIEFRNHKTQIQKKEVTISEPLANNNLEPTDLTEKTKIFFPENLSPHIDVKANNSVKEQKASSNKFHSSLAKTISNYETTPDKKEREQVKQERTSRTLLNCLIAGFVILFTYMEIWIPAIALCLLLLLLIHCRRDPLTTVRKRAARHKVSQNNNPVSEPEYVNQPKKEYDSDKRRVHAGAILCFPFVLFPPLSFIGLIIGSVALSDINKQPARYKGKVGATVGIVLNAIWTAILLAILIAIFMF